ncbi:DUF262 domain-containing protein [Paracoccus sanguinis]|nr:DUF262 domain-containing protein [Paracoccus sanguinis]
MKQFDARAYSIADFAEWHANSLLDLSPKFQRRSVWTRKAKSFLVDTILRGKPMPKVILMQDLVDKKNVRTVVDGQQRIRTILEFLSDSFSVLPTHNKEFGGMKFSELSEDAQTAFLQYEVGVDLLFNLSLADILDIFARINTYSVTLNAQEKLNAKFLGQFKTCAYELGHAYAKYWLDGKVLTEKAVSRMGEAQLASDLLVSLVDGVQTNKNVEKIYRKYEVFDQPVPEIEEAKERFHEVMAQVGAIYPAKTLASTNWSRPHWFYTLFTALAHSKYGLVGMVEPDEPAPSPEPPLNNAGIIAWREALGEISALYDKYTEDPQEDVPASVAKFINYAQRRTTDTEARIERAKYVLASINDAGR